MVLRLAARMLLRSSIRTKVATRVPSLSRGLTASGTAVLGASYLSSFALGSLPAECATATAALTPSTTEPPIRILCLHGITSDMYGSREATYGTATLAQIDKALHTMAPELGVEIE